MNADAIETPREFYKRVGLKRTAVRERQDPTSPKYDPNFPKPVSLGGGNSIGYRLSETLRWIESRPRYVAPRAPKQLNATKTVPQAA